MRERYDAGGTQRTRSSTLREGAGVVVSVRGQRVRQSRIHPASQCAHRRGRRIEIPLLCAAQLLHRERHDFASRAIALGESLPMISKLLGNTQVQTTARYAHLANESVKASGSRVGDSIGTRITPVVPQWAILATLVQHNHLSHCIYFYYISNKKIRHQIVTGFDPLSDAACRACCANPTFPRITQFRQSPFPFPFSATPAVPSA